MKAYQKMNNFVESKGIKQAFISEKTGIPKNIVSKILKGDRKFQADEFLAFCEAINVNPNDFRF